MRILVPCFKNRNVLVKQNSPRPILLLGAIFILLGNQRELVLWLKLELNLLIRPVYLLLDS